MRKFPDNYFDLAITDPPYFNGPNRRKYYGRSESTTNIKRVKYGVIDKWDVPGQEYFDELQRVSKHQIIWGINYYDVVLGPGRIIWDKVNGSSSFSDCEIAYCSKHDSVRMFRYMWNGMMQGKSIEEGHIQQGNKRLNEKRIHPTQKPVNLYRWILNTYGKPGDRILDTHVGSASSLIACDELGYLFVGFELDKEQFEKSNNRLLEAQAQMRIIELQAGMRESNSRQ
ncbi:DNA methyltransferase [Aequitasia blattaphilus]|uniref:Methyltransferase n=1 Tax=Aequitasia blattaphilus TaxID=2949332 RepID=A0ABT1ED16_9FIRM|nr:DNA methyltransferase [Aequitasia blattaphilus]MCP1103738.1 DNA methyltransferase [Aequitasia blattaphilus]MCR8616378.1 site-specific DNA-methyltransferase [Aequitasia blattaphilus]